MKIFTCVRCVTLIEVRRVNINNQLVAAKRNQLIDPFVTVSTGQELQKMFRESLVLEIRENQFKNRMKHKTGQLTESHLLTVDRKKIAQIKTIINEKKSEEASA